MVPFEDVYYVEKTLGGDTQAFAALVNRYKNMVYTLAIRMLKTSEEAEEASQDSFLKAYKSLNSFRGESKFSTWLYKITYHRCLDILRTSKNKEVTFNITDTNEHQLETIDSALTILESKERAEIIKNCIQQLPPVESFILSLYYYEDLPLNEIAEVVGIKANNVKIKLYRSRKRLASILRLHLEPEEIEKYE